MSTSFVPVRVLFARPKSEADSKEFAQPPRSVLAQVPDEPPFFESPYGPGTLAGTDGSRQPVEAELTTAVLRLMTSTIHASEQ
jgi:hypothetical protein